METIQLPIVKKPPILCYNHHAHFLSVLFTREKFLHEFLNYYIGLRFTVGEEKIMNFTDMICSSCDHLFDSFRIIFSNATDRYSQSIYNVFDLISYAENALSAGYYLTGSWNEKQVPGTKAYGKYPLLHDYLIYGFHSKNEVFQIIGYDKTSKYRESLISYREMKEAFFFPGVNTSIVAFKPLEDSVYSFDVTAFYRELEIYLQPNLEQNTYYNVNALEKFLEILTEFSLLDDLDLRIVQVIYEHKNAMFERMKYLVQNDITFNKKWMDDYENVRRQSLILKNLALKFNFIKQPSLKHDMCEILQNIITREKIILNELLLNGKRG